jgi:hypothetical protein
MVLKQFFRCICIVYYIYCPYISISIYLYISISLYRYISISLYLYLYISISIYIYLYLCNIYNIYNLSIYLSTFLFIPSYPILFPTETCRNMTPTGTPPPRRAVTCTPWAASRCCSRHGWCRWGEALGEPRSAPPEFPQGFTKKKRAEFDGLWWI